MKIISCLICFAFALIWPKQFYNIYAQDLNAIYSKDSITKLFILTDNKSLDKAIRLKYLTDAYLMTSNFASDSLTNNYYHEIAARALVLNDSVLFRLANNKSITWSKKLRDSTKLANNYWDLGDFFDFNGKKDSAYYAYNEAKKIYEANHNDFYQGRMLLNMAIVQSDIKDYTGSEITSIKAIKLLEPLKKHFQLYSVYNNLGIVLNELEDYRTALEYHQKAFGYQKKIEGEHTLKENSYNNIGIVYKNLKEYARAVSYYNQALKRKDLAQANPKLYAMLLDNKAYSQFKLGETRAVEGLLKRSLKIRDSIGDTSGYTINLLHLAEYYAYKKDTLKALQFAKKAENIAIENKNNRDLLSALWYLSQIDQKNQYTYSQRHIILSDSLLKQERIIRNKFTRIRFETDKFIERNIDLSEKNKWLLYGGSTILALGVAFWLVRKQRMNKLMLKMTVQQKELNDQIYNTMLKQQTAINDAKNKEKEKISRELHDGVLSELHHTRVRLSKISEDDNDILESILSRQVNSLKKIEHDIRKVSHSLHRQSLSNLDFDQTLSGLIEKNRNLNNYQLVYVNDGEIQWELVSNIVKMNVYRILQENLNNINKYAYAKEVKIKLKEAEKHVHILISDDGIGFNPNRANKGIGLKNMKARVEELGGNIEIISSKGNGTKVKIDIPLFNSKK
ncbi:MAG: hypothetical protein CSA39_06240 [Flavobacteriales bacterium]|nr:MAG: hypothetical protein CSA39_06240 [Flavobacteriales bacterium]